MRAKCEKIDVGFRVASFADDQESGSRHFQPRQVTRFESGLFMFCVPRVIRLMLEPWRAINNNRSGYYYRLSRKLRLRDVQRIVKYMWRSEAAGDETETYLGTYEDWQVIMLRTPPPPLLPCTNEAAD